MIPYEEYLPLLPHEYTYAQYLSYEFDIWMYDPMILNMVSERYPRDEDYASDADSDSNSITDEDFDFDIPPWLFQNLEDEDGSLIQQENNHFKIVFGSFGKDSDLGIVCAISLNPIKPEIEGSTIKIGQVDCSLNTVKPQIKICSDALLSDPEVKDENNSEKIFTDENNSEKISSDLRSEIPNLFKKMLRIPDRLLALNNVLLASPDPVHVSHHDFVFGCNDWIDFNSTAPNHFLFSKKVLPASLDFVRVSHIEFFSDFAAALSFSSNSAPISFSYDVGASVFNFRDKLHLTASPSHIAVQRSPGIVTIRLFSQYLGKFQICLLQLHFNSYNYDLFWMDFVELVKRLSRKMHGNLLRSFRSLNAILVIHCDSSEDFDYALQLFDEMPKCLAAVWVAITLEYTNIGFDVIAFGVFKVKKKGSITLANYIKMKLCFWTLLNYELHDCSLGGSVKLLLECGVEVEFLVETTSKTKFLPIHMLPHIILGRCLDVGIAERHTLIAKRGYDQVAHDVDFQRLPVRFVLHNVASFTKLLTVSTDLVLKHCGGMLCTCSTIKHINFHDLDTWWTNHGWELLNYGAHIHLLINSIIPLCFDYACVLENYEGLEEAKSTLCHHVTYGKGNLQIIQLIDGHATDIGILLVVHAIEALVHDHLIAQKEKASHVAFPFYCVFFAHALGLFSTWVQPIFSHCKKQDNSVALFGLVYFTGAVWVTYVCWNDRSPIGITLIFQADMVITLSA